MHGIIEQQLHQIMLPWELQSQRYTACTALIAMFAGELQAARALLEEQLVQERNLRLAVEASRETLSQQLAEQQSDLATAKQQVCTQLHSLAQTALLMLYTPCTVTCFQLGSVAYC